MNFCVRVVGDLKKQQIDPGILTECDEACLGMLKVLSNDELVSNISRIS